jgi:hypothetical protein
MIGANRNYERTIETIHGFQHCRFGANKKKGFIKLKIKHGIRKDLFQRKRTEQAAKDEHYEAHR